MERDKDHFRYSLFFCFDSRKKDCRRNGCSSIHLRNLFWVYSIS